MMRHARHFQASVLGHDCPSWQLSHSRRGWILSNDIVRGKRKQGLLMLALLVAQTHGVKGSSSWHGRPDAPGYPPRDPRRNEGFRPDRSYGGERDDPRRYDGQNEGTYRDDRLYSREGYRDDEQRNELQDFAAKQPPPPPPPGSSSSSSYEPIHYQFPASSKPDARESDIDRQDDEFSEFRRDYASPRNDIITRYMSNKQKRALLTLSAGTVGASLGIFVGKSLMNAPKPFAVAFCFVFIACTFVRNPYGELSRALGMALILAFQRSHAVRKRYATWPHVKACLGGGPRIPTDSLDEDYNQLYALLSMLLVGFACGSSLSLPLLPHWMGAMAGAASFGFATTLPTANGDLARTMGMRVVGLFEEVLAVNGELHMMRKVGVVAGKILDKILVLDRKHRIKDRLIAVFSWAYEQVSRTAEQVQRDIGRDDDQAREEGDRRYNEPRR